MPIVTTGDLISAADWNGLSQAMFDDTLTSSSSGILIDNIPQGYAHLRLTVVARSDDAAASVPVRLRFNADTGTSYLTQELLVNGSTVSGTRPAATTSISLGNISAAGSAGDHTGSIVTEIPDYTSTTWRKRVVSQGGYRTGATGPVLRVHGGEWTASTSAITRIDLLTTGNFLTGSRFTLHGVGEV